MTELHNLNQDNCSISPIYCKLKHRTDYRGFWMQIVLILIFYLIIPQSINGLRIIVFKRIYKKKTLIELLVNICHIEKNISIPKWIKKSFTGIKIKPLDKSIQKFSTENLRQKSIVSNISGENLEYKKCEPKIEKKCKLSIVNNKVKPEPIEYAQLQETKNDEFNLKNVFNSLSNLDVSPTSNKYSKNDSPINKSKRFGKIEFFRACSYISKDRSPKNSNLDDKSPAISSIASLFKSAKKNFEIKPAPLYRSILVNKERDGSTDSKKRHKNSESSPLPNSSNRNIVKSKQKLKKVVIDPNTKK